MSKRAIWQAFRNWGFKSALSRSDQYSFQAKPTEEEAMAGVGLAGKFIDRMARLLEQTVA
jgi:hypothetical protein